MRIEILNVSGQVISTIVATEEFAEAQFPGFWRAAPALPQEAPPIPVPASVTRRQGRLALLAAGKLDTAEAAIAAIEDPVQRRAAQIEYEADTWERGNAFLVSLWQGMGGTLAELEELFRLADTL